MVEWSLSRTEMIVLSGTGNRPLAEEIAQVTQLVAAGAPADAVQELLEEVFDLVRLGSADAA